MDRTYRHELACEMHYACVFGTHCIITKSNRRECGQGKIVVVEEWPFFVKEERIPAGPGSGQEIERLPRTVGSCMDSGTLSALIACKRTRSSSLLR